MPETSPFAEARASLTVAESAILTGCAQSAAQRIPTARRWDAPLVPHLTTRSSQRQPRRRVSAHGLRLLQPAPRSAPLSDARLVDEIAVGFHDSRARRVLELE